MKSVYIFRCLFFFFFVQENGKYKQTVFLFFVFFSFCQSDTVRRRRSINIFNIAVYSCIQRINPIVAAYACIYELYVA